MNNFAAKHAALSIGGFAAGLMTAQIHSIEPVVEERRVPIEFYVRGYTASSVGSTYGDYSSLFAGGALATSERLDSIYSTLAMAQERLGIEFEKVLFDNLWELYAR